MMSNCQKFEFLDKFAAFRRFARQQIIVSGHRSILPLTITSAMTFGPRGL